MTRLAESDIATVTELLASLDAELIAATGANLWQIAHHAVGADYANHPIAAQGVTTSVVPITAGLGTIGGFSQTLAGILNHLGLHAFVTKHTDAWGIYEGRLQSVCQMFSDDDLFVAINNATNRMSENGYATGIGFAAALDLAAGGVQGKRILVAGAGPVGCAAAAYLTRKGGEVVLYDIDPTKLENQPYQTTTSIAGMQFSYILEATTAENVITPAVLAQDAIVSAPGVPLGVPQPLADQLLAEHRLIHNPLELGTAVMIADVLHTAT